MISRAIWIWSILALGLGFGLFQLKYQVQGLEQKLARINRQILENEEAIHVLKAEWSYLNQPERIDVLSRKYLGLQPLTGQQYSSFADLPLRDNAVAPGTEHPSEAAPNTTQKVPANPAPMPAERPALQKGSPETGRKGSNLTLAREVL